MDDEGYVFVVGRTKDHVKKMGQSLSPALPETILRQQPGVEGAVVVGIPQEDYGEVPVAVIKPSDQNHLLDREQLSTAVANRLGEYYTLAHIFKLEDLHLDNWPLNLTGKVIKVVLRERVVAAIESSA
ncbi:hypothetical protein PRZ48_002567 [Zasmidium cellare]|uniref:AMP-binding enzyme C-terminal domain-containing protein n=1 Tax=Zasmidium cellare TaxID=395010 RepID=A0ABR0EU41_ZASCE|nr:hypothetical protein PRZ48_002567 [Zasmidium cellare]